MSFFFEGFKNKFESAVVNETSVFVPLKFYCIQVIFQLATKMSYFRFHKLIFIKKMYRSTNIRYSHLIDGKYNQNMEKKNSYYSYARPAQPGPNRTRLCGQCITAIAGD